MFVIVGNTAINLSHVEQVEFAVNTTVIVFTSGETLFVDLEYAEKIEKALDSYNERG